MAMAQIVNSKGPLGWIYSGGRDKWRKFDRDMQVESLSMGGPNLKSVWMGEFPAFLQDGEMKKNKSYSSSCEC